MYPIRTLLASSTLLLLAACDAGNSPTSGASDGGGNEPPPQSGALDVGAAPLTTKTDALRELNIATSLAWQVADGKIGLAAAGAQAKRVRIWSFAHGETEAAAAERADAGSGSAGGTFNAVYGAGSHDFRLLGESRRAVELARRSDNAFKNSWTQTSGAVESLTTDGDYENGQTADGLRYAVLGAGSEYYTETYENSRDTQAGTQIALLGVSEARLTSGQALDARATLRYRYEGRGSEYFHADIGEAGSPFVVQQGDSLRYEGVYAYRYAGVSGGKTKVTTLSPISLDGTGQYPRAGKLRFEAGNATATIEFNADGSATLSLNDVPQTVTAAEIRSALINEPSA